MAFVDRDSTGAIFARSRVASPDPVDCMVSVNDVLPWVFPCGALNAEPFQNRGRFGYKQTADISWLGASKPCGFMARGGNGGTVLVSISGAGIPFIGNANSVAGALRALDARITRLDCAFDDFEGEHLSIADLVYDARCGIFQRGPMPPALKLIDDLGTGSGSSFYVGTKGRTELCVYEKGKQQGDKLSSWIRAEARLWSADRTIPYAAMLDPIGMILGAYPSLTSYLPDVAPRVSERIKRQVQANAQDMIDWLSSAAGKSLDLLRESAMEVGITDSEILNLITRQGTPSRFAGVPAEVVHKRIGDYLIGESNVEGTSGIPSGQFAFGCGQKVRQGVCVPGTDIFRDVRRQAVSG
jgi:phage replication initiation protein